MFRDPICGLHLISWLYFCLLKYNWQKKRQLEDQLLFSINEPKKIFLWNVLLSLLQKITVSEPPYLCLIPVFWCGWSRHHNKNIPFLQLVRSHSQHNQPCDLKQDVANIYPIFHSISPVWHSNNWALSVVPMLTLSTYLRFSSCFQNRFVC